MTPKPDRTTAVPPALRDAVLAWYDSAGRRLAFRATRDPYAVLVSELMAQQTQAARAARAWTAWMARFPTVERLAAASAAEVLRAWAGLGYNRRAVNLHRAAKAIMADHGGRVPDTVEGLMTLPGVGPYTARAVAAIAFGVPVGAVDTNVRRVLGRVVAGDAAGLAAAEVQRVADASVPPDRAGDWTHALMDLGAGPCGPRSPRCGACPAQPWCRFAADGRSRDRPAAGTGVRGQAGPFPLTTRWLRGRVLVAARDIDATGSAPMPGGGGASAAGRGPAAVGDGGWVTYADPIGVHDAHAVREAVIALGNEGLLEVRETPAGIEGRLPTG